MDPFPEARVDESLQRVGGVVEAAALVPDERDRQRRALPAVVMRGLGDRRAEAPAQLRLERLQLLPLALEVGVRGEMELEL